MSQQTITISRDDTNESSKTNDTIRRIHGLNTTTNHQRSNLTGYYNIDETEANKNNINEGFALNNKQLSETIKLTNAIDYLKNFKKKSPNNNRLIDDKHAYEAIFLLRQLVTTKTTTLLQLDCEKLFIDLLLEIYSILPAIDFENFEIDTQIQCTDTLKLRTRQTTIIAFVFDMLGHLTLSSVQFCHNFVRLGGLQPLLAFIADELIFVKCLRVDYREGYQDTVWYAFFFADALLMVLLNLSKSHGAANRQLWHDSEAIQLLGRLVNKRTSHVLELLAFMTICNITNDTWIETHPDESRRAVKLLNGYVKTCAHRLQNQAVVERRLVQIMDNGKLKDVLTHSISLNEYTYAYLIDLLEALCKLSVNARLRGEMYKCDGEKILSHLKVILQKGNKIEKKLVLYMLCQFAFEKEIARDIASDVELVEYLKLGIEGAGDESAIGRLRNVILWYIRALNDERKVVVGSGGPDDDPDSRNVSRAAVTSHLMISYHPSNRDFCLMVKDELKKAGYQVLCYYKDEHGE